MQSILANCLIVLVVVVVVVALYTIYNHISYPQSPTINLMRTSSLNPDFDITSIILTSTMIFSPCLE
jgi:hypothetical protein